MNVKRANLLLLSLVLFKLLKVCLNLVVIWFLFLFFAENMKSIRDWVFSQLLTQSLPLSLPLSASNRIFNEEKPNEELDDQGSSSSLHF